MTKVVNLVSPRKEICHSARRRLVDNGRRDNVDHVSVVIFDGNVEFGLGVEAAQSSQVDVASQNCDADRKLGTYALKHSDQLVSLLFVSSCSVMVVEVVKEVHTPVETVEEAAAQPYPSVQKLDWAEHGTGKDVF